MNNETLSELKKILHGIEFEIKRAEQIIETGITSSQNQVQEINKMNIKHRRKALPKIIEAEAVQRWNKITEEINLVDSIEDFRLFLRSLTTTDLAAFIKFNKLPVNSKMKKEQIINGIMQLLKAGQAIQQPLKRSP